MLTYTRCWGYFRAAKRKPGTLRGLRADSLDPKLKAVLGPQCVIWICLKLARPAMHCQLPEGRYIFMAKIGRDAGTGKFTTVKVAQQQPKTHVVETIKKSGKK